MATIARAPAPTASVTVGSSPSAGTHTTTRSRGPTEPVASASEPNAGRPSTCPPRRLTRATTRGVPDSKGTPREDVAPLGGILAGSDHGDGAGVEEGRQAPLDGTLG